MRGESAKSFSLLAGKDLKEEKAQESSGILL